MSLEIPFDERTLTPEECAEWLKTSKRHLLSNPRIPKMKVGKKIRFHVRTVREALERMRRKP